jgi:hypothetical protein
MKGMFHGSQEVNRSWLLSNFSNNENSDLQARESRPSSLFQFESRRSWYISMTMAIPATKLCPEGGEPMTATYFQLIQQKTIAVALLAAEPN